MKMETEEMLTIKEALKWMLDTIEREGSIDHVTHEGMIEDCKEALANSLLH